MFLDFFFHENLFKVTDNQLTCPRQVDKKEREEWKRNKQTNKGENHKEIKANG